MNTFLVKTTVLVIIVLYSTTIQAQYMGRATYKQLTNDDFKEVVSLQSDTLDVISGKLIRPVKMNLLGHYLVISDISAQKNIHIVDIKENKYLGGFIDIGSGPDELSSQWGLSKSSDSTFIVSDTYYKKFLGFNINELLTTGKSFIRGEIDKEDIPYFFDYNEDKNSLLYAGHLTNEFRLHEKDLDSGTISGYGELLKDPTGKSDEIKVRNFLSVANISSNRSYFAFAYIFAPMVEVFDYQKKETKTVLLPDNKEPTYYAREEEEVLSVGAGRDATLEFDDITMSENYIYALYTRRKMKNLNSGKSRVYVFDYKLNPIKIYNLDRYIQFFDVDNDNVIYGLHTERLGSESDKQKVFIYNLKH
ncbi:BF3164 family lipoprotein [Aquimarina macrocephali]|uniref:BF3164 family lipoprotein n=1 Tax=Aquimarina macrocephali TaxID=666563 RepID=UPI000462F80F|nr:BF3164 family lipoprotein [Aquimarina macrocephali]